MSGALNMATNKITALGTPTVSTDAATKAYVDLTQTASGITGGTITGATLTNDTIDSTPIGSTTRSTVKATTLDLGLSTQSVAIGQGNASIMKNRIINGAMVISQRYGTTATANTINDYTLDRFAVYQTTTGKLITQQLSSSPPVGFTNYLGITSQSAFSIGSGDYYVISQIVEGYNAADLGWGTANAKTVTLSFWVQSSLTGTFGGCIRNNSSPYYPSYPFTYSISVANTWTQISVTIAGPTTGTWNTTNGGAFNVYFGLGVGSTLSGTAGSWQNTNLLGATGATSVVGTSGATFYITGVQLEVGSSATGFEYRQVTQELSLCQRYFYKTYNQSVVPASNSAAGGQAGALMLYIPATGNTVRNTMFFKTTMRTTPTITTYNPETGTAGYAAYEGSGASNQVALGTTYGSDNGSLVYGLSAGFTGSLYWQTTASAEL